MKKHPEKKRARNRRNDTTRKNLFGYQFDEFTGIGLSEEESYGSRTSEDEFFKKTEKIPQKLYFNAGTQAAIVKFQSDKDKKSREKLYVEEILPAFEKLVENLINIHKFSGMYFTYEELKNDCVNFLFETIPKFDPSFGSNAFSYFNVVAKNWLIIRTKQKMQNAKRSVSLDDPLGLTVHETLIIEEQNILPSQDLLLESVDSAEHTQVSNLG